MGELSKSNNWLKQIWDALVNVVNAAITAIQTATESIDDKMDNLINRVEQLEGGYVAMTGKQSGGDFVTARGATNRVDCTGLPSYHSTLIIEDIEKVVKIVDADDTRVEYLPGDGTGGTFVMSIAADNITVTGMTSAANDDFIVYTNVSQFVNPYQGTPTSLVGATGLTAAYVDAGAQIDVRNRDVISLFGTLTIGTSTAVSIRVLCLHTAAGTEYESEDNDMYIYNFPTDATQNRVLVVDVAGWAYAQVQIKDNATGTGTLAIDYILD